MYWQDHLSRVAGIVGRYGFDIVAPCQLKHYNRECPTDWQLDGKPQDLVLLIGNTKEMWPHFTDAYANSGELARRSDPLDHWVEEALGPCARDGQRLYYGHRDQVDMRRLATVTGVGRVGEAGLIVHPIFGPWLALRAALVVPERGPSNVTKPDKSCVCESGCQVVRGENNWKLWLARRDACPVGRAHRYSEQQIKYHYTKDKNLLT